MKRLLGTTALAGALALGIAAPSHAAPPTPGGQCEGKVDVACREDTCVPDYPCTPVICLVWVGSKCGVL
jgi:hypothetical protein